MKQFMLILGSLVVLLLTVGSPVRALARTDTVVRIEPATAYLTPEETIMIEIWVENVTDLSGYDLIIGYDPDRLIVSEPEFGTFLDPFLEWINQGTVGELQFVRAQSSGSLPKTGDGMLAKFRIEAKEYPGDLQLELFLVELSTSDGALIPCEIEHATIHIVGAADDTYQTPANETLTVAVPGVLENDIAPEGVTFTDANLNNPFTGVGVLAWHEDGSFDYTPPAGWSGQVSFTYMACDVSDTCYGPAAVTITVESDKTDYLNFLPLILY